MLRRIRTCVTYAAGFATLYSGVAAFQLAADPSAAAALSLSVPRLLAAYWVGAVLAGVVVAVLWPLARTVAGSPVVGMVAAFPLMLGLALLSARPGTGRADLLLHAALLSMCLGGGGGAVLHYVFTDGA